MTNERLHNRLNGESGAFDHVNEHEWISEPYEQGD